MVFSIFVLFMRLRVSYSEDYDFVLIPFSLKVSLPLLACLSFPLIFFFFLLCIWGHASSLKSTSVAQEHIWYFLFTLGKFQPSNVFQCRLLMPSSGGRPSGENVFAEGSKTVSPRNCCVDTSSIKALSLRSYTTRNTKSETYSSSRKLTIHIARSCNLRRAFPLRKLARGAHIMYLFIPPS